MAIRAHKYRFYPTPTQESLLRRTFGCVRLVYNKALRLRTDGWYERKERINYEDTSAALTVWKKQDDLQFLNEISSVPMQQSLRHLQKAFGNFWAKKTGYPKFKRKRHGGSAEFTSSAFKFRDGKLFLAKLEEPLNIVWSRELPDGVSPTTVTISLDAAGRWFASLLFDAPIPEVPPATGQVGLDMGISSLVTLSTGEKITNPKHLNKDMARLRKAQRRMDRKHKGSQNRRKAALKVARVHARIADRRADHLHQLSTRLVQENQLIAVEDLAVRNMVRNHSLARSISDAGWSELVRQLEYKAFWYGRTLVKVDGWFPSSKRCSGCGHVVEKLPLDVRAWTCPSCNSSHDRDANAAINVLAAGQAALVCGDGVRLGGHSVLEQPSVKQKVRSVRVGIPRL